MNKEEAIKKLKYYKELLEIEAISKEEKPLTNCINNQLTAFFLFF